MLIRSAATAAAALLALASHAREPATRSAVCFEAQGRLRVAIAYEDGSSQRVSGAYLEEKVSFARRAFLRDRAAASEAERDKVDPREYENREVIGELDASQIRAFRIGKRELLLLADDGSGDASKGVRGNTLSIVAIAAPGATRVYEGVLTLERNQQPSSKLGPRVKPREGSPVQCLLYRD